MIERETMVRDRAVRLFTYLRRVSEMRTSSVRSLEHYERVLWLSEVHGLGVYCAAEEYDESRSSDGWIVVERPSLPPPPPVPDRLQPWLDPKEVGDSYLEYPELRQRIPTNSSVGDEAGEPSHVVLSDVPQIERLWNDYVERMWWPWAANDRQLRPVQKLYSDLFTLYQKQHRLSEVYEVVLGLGLMTWVAPDGAEIRRHLLTAHVGIEFDPLKGIISVGPAAEGAKVALETDMLEADWRPEATIYQAVEADVAGIGDEVWDRKRLESIFTKWANGFSGNGRYCPELGQPGPATSDCRIDLAPALILRKRSDRGLLRVLDEIVQQIQSGGKIPPGVETLVVTVVDTPGKELGTSIERTCHELPVERVYFPLPANDEQQRIVERLVSQDGVVVQGPPGTGKSHTIANLICHLLATGQRVLVTSQAPRALEVLKRMLPPAVRDLSISVLSSDTQGMDDLERSVQKIIDAYDSWDRAGSIREIEKAERELDAAKRQEAEMLLHLRGAREAATYRHVLGFGGYGGTTSEIARRLRTEEQAYSWVGSMGADAAPPLGSEESPSLLGLLRQFPSDQDAEIRRPLVPTSALRDPGEFQDLAGKEATAQQQYSAMRDHCGHALYNRLVSRDGTTLESLVHGLDTWLMAHANLCASPQPWVARALEDALAGQITAWSHLHNETSTHLQELEMHSHSLDSKAFGLEGRDLRTVEADVVSILSCLSEGRGLGFGPFRPKSVRQAQYVLSDIRIDGTRCNSADTLEELVNLLRVTRHLESLDALWGSLVVLPSASPSVKVAAYRDQNEILSRIARSAEDTHGLVALIGEGASLAIPWNRIEEVKSLYHAVQTALLQRQFADASQPLVSLEAELVRFSAAHDAHPIAGTLLEAVQSRNATGYQSAYRRLQDLERDQECIRLRDELLWRLRDTAPTLSDSLTATVLDAVWDERMRQFGLAWNWSRADLWLKSQTEQMASEELTRRLLDARTAVRDITARLAASKAWMCFFERMDEHQRKSLIAWSMAIKKAGKRTGKYAPQHLANARRYLEECRSAIPAWVMPMYRVADTIRPGVDAFDVVVVDEASQCGQEALFLQYLARKIVIVGDEEQISPENVGLDRDIVNELRRTLIPDLPFGDTFGLDDSLFSQARLRFGNQVALREHFRCMPEIIQFSNNLCYTGRPLIPLRQYGADRLSPIVVRHVTDGYVEGSGQHIVNSPEAQAIAEQIRSCCKDPKYEGKTMGVISLQGSAQAALIHNSLLRSVGPEEMEKRRIVCGDAYDFQGDERDVIFLSLVAAPSDGRRIGVLSRDHDKRRFNVAASRARDQMWLYHTATLNDLSPKCFRYSLLQYCQNPSVEPGPDARADLEELRQVAEACDRSKMKAPPPFDSWFEVDVYLQICGRGYRVIPQYEIAGYRIDLVVEGMDKRVAVECDGDVWHGPEKYDEDTARQRQLERCGWQFWRIRGSTYYRDPDTSIQELFQSLKRLDIFPHSVGLGIGPDLERKAPTRAEPPGQGADDQAARAVGEEPAQSELFQTVRVVKSDPEDRSDDLEAAGPILPDQEDSRAANAGHGRTVVKPYECWEPRELPDPRSAPRDAIRTGLLEIVTTEGPATILRVCRLYAEAAGITRLGREVCSSLVGAVRGAVRIGLLQEGNDDGARDPMSKVIRLPSQACVVVRSQGNRTLDEVPLSEIAELISIIQSEDTGGTIPEEVILREVADHYGIHRVAARVKATLSEALGLADRRGV